MLTELPDLAVLERIAAGASGLPMQLPLADIDEDPEQPRHEFEAEALEELAATIAAGGVRQPVSVRPHPSAPGRWMLNFGARRLRASRLAGKTEIPAFVDEVFDSYTQVIENEQREPLKPLELALFMQRRLAAGESPGDIARRLGKSRGYLTFVGALVDPPAFLLDLYRTGRCTGITELYDLRKLHETNREEVEHWARAQESVSRNDLRQLKVALASGSATQDASPMAIPAIAPPGPGDDESGRSDPPSLQSSAQAAVLRKPKPTIVLQALFKESEVRVDLTVVPEVDGQIWIRDSTSQQAMCVDARELRLLRVCLI
jgi:ParB family chromosome partitioning protein